MDDGLDEAVAALRAFALVDREPVPDERDSALLTDCIRLHRLVRDCPRSLRPFDSDLPDALRLRHDLAAALAHGFQRRVQRARQLLLDLDVADRARPVARLQILDLRRIGIEGVMVHEDRVAFDSARNIGPDPLRIRVHLAHLLHDGLRIVAEIDGVAVTLAHLAVVESGQARHRREQRLRLDENLAVELVEPAHDLTRELQVRDLILAYRNEFRVVHRDVSCLQQRITEEADRREVLLGELLLLFLVRRNPFEPWDRDDHRQQQEQLGVLRDERLHEDGAALRVDAGRNPVGEIVERVTGDRLRVRILAGQRVPVGDEVEAVVLFLERDPILERAHEVAEMQFARRPHAGNDSRF